MISFFFTLGVHSGQNVYVINRPERCSKTVLLTGKPKSLKNTRFPRLSLVLEIQGVGELKKDDDSIQNTNCFSPITDFPFQLLMSIVSGQRVQVQPDTDHSATAGGRNQHLDASFWERKELVESTSRCLVTVSNGILGSR